MGRKSSYAREFRLQAAKLVVEQGCSYREVEERLGVSRRSLRNWVDTFRAAGQLPLEGQGVSAVEQLKATRKELARLQMENEILKKAAAYFARESL